MRKIVSIVGGVLLLVLGFFFAKSLASTEKKQRPQPEATIQSVFVEEVVNQDIPTIVYESGVLNARNRVELYAEVQGVMEQTGKVFKPGTRYRKGEVLVRIRNNDYLANLQSQKSTLQNLVTSIMPDLRLDFPDAYEKWDQYIRYFDINKPIKSLPEPTSEKEKFFITGKNIYSTYYATKNMELVYNKYTLRAPFDGILTDSQVNPGTLIRQGQQLGELIDPSVYEMEVSVGKKFYPYLKEGTNVTVTEGSEGLRNWQGRIVRINGRVDPSTQTVRVFIELRGQDLKEGMFLEAEIKGKEETNAFEIDRSVLINNNSLYVVREGKLALIEVDPVFFTQSTVIVKGLQNGEKVVSKPVAGAFSGMEVAVIDKKAQG